MLLRFVIIRLLIVIYSVRTRSVTIVLPVVIITVPVVAVAVSVLVSVSFAVFIFVAVVVQFFSVRRFAASFADSVGYGFFRLVFLVTVSIAFLFLLFQGCIETGNAILSQNILCIAFWRLRLGISFECDGFVPFLFMLITSKARLAEIVTKLAANDLSVDR